MPQFSTWYHRYVFFRLGRLNQRTMRDPAFFVVTFMRPSIGGFGRFYFCSSPPRCAVTADTLWMMFGPGPAAICPARRGAARSAPNLWKSGHHLGQHYCQIPIVARVLSREYFELVRGYVPLGQTLLNCGVRGLMLRTNAAWFNRPARRFGRTLAKRRRCPILVRATRHASS
jgi:hypothetical protein